MRRTEDRNRTKVLEIARDKGSKDFWRALKNYQTKTRPNQRSTEYPTLFYKNSLVFTDKEKIKLFKRLLRDIKKNQETESPIISELSNNIENETKAMIITNGDIELLGIVVTTEEYEETLIKEKHARGRTKFVTNSSMIYLRMLKPLPVSSYLAP